MTNTSKQGGKGRLLLKIKNGIQREPQATLNEERLSFILRDILSVALQRDRYSYSFYSTTTSGLALVNALNESKFIAIKELLKSDDKPIEYSDLTSFVLGRNDPAYFNSQDMGVNFTRVEDHRLGEDGYRMLI